jgi:heme-degrading monooxygenase HmoA
MDPNAPLILPRPPYYCVIFTSLRTAAHQTEYEIASERMEHLAQVVPGYLGMESVRGADGTGITVSYWECEEAITEWRENVEHVMVQKMGREKFYRWYDVRVGRIERASSFHAGRRQETR